MRDLIRIVEGAQDNPGEAFARRVSEMELPATIDVIPWNDVGGYTDVVELTGLAAPVRGQGMGGRTMRAVTSLADQMGVTLVLQPSSDLEVDGAMDTNTLIDWYHGLGFTNTLEDSGDFFMVRVPGN